MAELKKLPGVKNATNSNLSDNYGVTSRIKYGDWNKEGEHYFSSLSVGYNFFETLNIKILEGRSFSKEIGNIFSMNQLLK